MARVPVPRSRVHNRTAVHAVASIFAGSEQAVEAVGLRHPKCTGPVTRMICIYECTNQSGLRTSHRGSAFGECGDVFLVYMDGPCGELSYFVPGITQHTFAPIRPAPAVEAAGANTNA